MRKIRIAQIGINRYSHAPEIFESLKEHTELFELAGYCIVEDERETCKEKIEKYMSDSKELTLEEILNDETIEAVTVETDEIHLLKYAQMAADAGKHIHMEKPGSQDLPAFERLIETMKKSGKVFHVGYMYRYNPYIAEAIRMAKAGEYGHIFSVEAHMSRLDDKATREWFDSFKGGMMFYLGCHLVDLVIQLQGFPTEILPLNTRSGIDGVDTEDCGFAVLKYPNATSFVRMSGAEVHGYNRRQLVICGEKRTTEIKPLEMGGGDPTIPYCLKTSKKECYYDSDGKILSENSTSAPFGRYEDMISAFAAMVRGERENPHTLEYELELFKVILKCCGM